MKILKGITQKPNLCVKSSASEPKCIWHEKLLLGSLREETGQAAN